MSFELALPTSPAHDSQPTPVRRAQVSRNITNGKKRTSVRLEPEMWNALTEITRREKKTVHEICTAVAQRKSRSTSLTAALRVFVMTYFRLAAAQGPLIKAESTATVSTLLHGARTLSYGLSSGHLNDARGAR